MIKISVILISYNRASEIERTIKSIIKQEYKNLEFILIDGGSSDETMQIVKKYQKYFSHIISEPDDGIFDAFNKGIKLSTGEIICLYTTATIMHNNILETVNNVWDKDTGVIYGDTIEINPVNNSKYYANARELKVLKQRGGAFRTEAAFISKDTILKYGLLDSTYKIAGDYNYFLKLYKKGVKFKYLNLPISEFELGGISSDGLECTKECKRALKNNGCNTFQISIIYFMRKIKIYNTFKNLSIKYIKKC